MTKIKVLFLVSNPLTQDRLALDEECRQISAKIRSSDHRDAIELIAAWAVRPPTCKSYSCGIDPTLCISAATARHPH